MPNSKIVTEVTMGRGPEWWTTLSPDQKRALTFPRLQEKESNQAIAEVFGITPNSIASIRNRWNQAKHRNPYTLVIRTESGELEHIPVEPPRAESNVEPVQPELVPFLTESVASLDADIEAQEPESGEALSFEKSASVEAGCMWPLAKSSSLKAKECGEKVVAGFRCCASHAPLVYGKRFTERN